MNLPLLTIDNVTELLIKIIEFTQIRQKVLTRNINNIRRAGFVPKDLKVDEFSEVLHTAIHEHTRNRRLVLCDTENIKFGINGSFEANAVADEYAKELLEENRGEYLQLQINKLLENSLNQRLAAELLRQREEAISIFE
jgi:flagellar basal body rod protein FlgB